MSKQNIIQTSDIPLDFALSIKLLFATMISRTGTVSLVVYCRVLTHTI